MGPALQRAAIDLEHQLAYGIVTQSDLEVAGAAPREIQHRLRHASLSTTEIFYLPFVERHQNPRWPKMAEALGLKSCAGPASEEVDRCSPVHGPTQRRKDN